MATESPILISEGTSRWQAPAMYKKQSSPEISIEGLDLFLKDQTLIPARSESAPPSMEGSLAAMENIVIPQKKNNNDNENKLPGNSLTSHKEEAEDEQSSDQSTSLSVEKVSSLTSPPSYDLNQIPNSNTSRLQNLSLGYAYASPNHFNHNPSTSEIQPMIYASTTAYMPHPGPYYLPYNMNSGILPSYVSGYPQQSSIPIAFDSASFPVHGYDTQNLLKYYNRIGVPLQLQPHFHAQYFHAQMRDSYNLYSHLNHQTPKDTSSEDSRREPQQHIGGGGYYENSNLKRGNVLNHYYYTAQPKPTAEANFPGGRYNVSNGSGQSWKDANFHSFLEELKSGKGQRLELADITGYIVEFSVDQHGSRFIQQKLETCSGEEKASVFTEVVPHASKLITDVFGNYVIQKLFEHGNPEQRMDLANQLEGQILPLSFQMYGCRVIQKALDVIDVEQKARLVRELDGHVLRCVQDQNGNHVIQKCIESIPTDRIHFIVSSFRGQVATLSMHPYGCRVIQRFLEHCNDNIQTQFIVDEILDSVCLLAQDQYGNYVTQVSSIVNTQYLRGTFVIIFENRQHVLERGNTHERSQIVEKLAGSIVQLSQHKFASNVIEKCLEYSDSTSREVLIKEIIGDKNDNLFIMMKDQYANYVIQRILEKCSNDHREVLLGQIRNHLTALKKYTYGKHIVTRLEKLYGEGS